MLPRFRWLTAAVDDAVAASCAERFSLPRPVAGVLSGRGLTDPDAIARFLAPRLQHLGDPLAFPGVEAAARRLWQAVAAREPVVVFGDFDADGVTAAALLVDALRALGGTAEAFLPDRLREGYGLTRAALERCLREHPARLLVTVDCGITAADEVAAARAAGLDVIVTDHHEPSARLPDAHALVNPRLAAAPGAEHLCGAGVAFKLVHALLRLGRDQGSAAAHAYDVRAWLDAVAVATVADVVPLLGENRVLVTAGLAALARRPRAGLRALKSRAGLHGAVGAYHLAFVLGPRLNAAGRMRTGWPAFRLLGATDPDAAMALAIELEGLNAERRGVEADLLAAATAQLAAGTPRGAVVVAGADWHMGAIGIVAARLAESHNLPAAVVSLRDDGGGRGSVRGGRGDNVVAALAACTRALEGFGGHPRAAGFTLKRGALDAFKLQFAGACAAQRGDGDPRPELTVDGWLAPADLGADLWQGLQRLEPFGEGHPRPRWAMRNLCLAMRPAPVGGSGEHLRLAFATAGGPGSVKGVWFKMGRLAEAIAQAGPHFDAVFELQENTYGGQSSLEMHVVDLRPARKA